MKYFSKNVGYPRLKPESSEYKVRGLNIRLQISFTFLKKRDTKIENTNLGAIKVKI